MNRCLQETEVPRMDDQRKNHINPERPPQRSHSKQLQNHNVPTYHLENTNGTNKGGNLLPGLFFEEQNGFRNETRGTGELLYIDQHILNESKTRRKIKLFRGLTTKRHLVCPAKLDNELSQNVQDIIRSYKLYRENHGNLACEFDSWRKKA